MKKGYLLAILIVGMIMYILAAITKAKFFLLLGGISTVITIAVQLWTTYNNKKKG